MSSEQSNNNKMLNCIALLTIAIFSLVAMILVLVSDFGWQDYGSGYSTYYFWLGNTNIDAWPQIFLVLIALVFFLSLVYSGLLFFVNLGKIPFKLSSKIQAFIGLAIAALAFISTLFTVGMWAIASIDHYWGVATTFYTSLVGSIIVAIFYVVYLINNKE